MNPFELLSPPREFAIYNPSETPVEIAYDGEIRTIPGRDDVVKPDPRDKYRCHSCIDTDGQLVPGTLILRDVEGPRGTCDGGRADVWSAANAIKERLQIDPTTGEGNGSFYKKGISLISTRPSPDEVATVHRQAQARHEQFLVEWAAHVQDDVVTRGQAHKSVGMNFIMTPKQHMELAKAEAILKATEAKYRDEALRAVGLVPPAGADEAELNSFVISKAEELANEHAKAGMDKAAFAKALVDDPEFRKMLDKEYWAKKKRQAKGQS